MQLFSDDNWVVTGQNNNMPASVAAGMTGSHLERVPSFFDKLLVQTGVFQTRSRCPLSCKFSLLHHTWSKWKSHYQASAELRTSWIWSRCVGADKHPEKHAGQQATGPGLKNTSGLENVRKLREIRQHVASCQILRLRDLKSSQHSLLFNQQPITYLSDIM